MAKDKRRMAQNRAKKQARRTTRRRIARRQSGSGGRFVHMGCSRGDLERSPIHAAYVGDSVFSQGLGHAIIARELPDGRIAAGVFLVDIYCLGVKNAFLMVQSPFEFEDTIETRFDANDLKPVDPAYARKLVDESVAYACDLGFEPHPDFRDASVVLGDIDPSTCDEAFTFGREGKPFYVSGPNHSEATARRIVAHLRSRCGLDGFHYMVGIQDSSAADAFGPDAHIMEEDDADFDEDGEE